MRSFLLKIPKIAILVFGFVFFSAQQSMKIPKDAVFYMEINGKQLDKKINWEKLNPFLQEITKKNKETLSWNDYTKTGIKYDATQYHYATFNDSVKAYHAYFTINDKKKFQEFIHSSKKEGLEITKKKKYSYIHLNDNVFVAWNGERAVLNMINYTKLDKYKDEDSIGYAIADSAAVMIDSTAMMVDSAYVEEPFNYKNEIEVLKSELKYLKDNIKDSKSEIAKVKKDIRYLKKHGQYPPDRKAIKDIDDSQYGAELYPQRTYGDGDEDEAMPMEDDEYELAYKKEMDSINIENFKMTRKLAEDKFDVYFNSNLQIEVPKEIIPYRDAKSDVFVYTDYGSILKNGLYDRMSRYGGFGGFFQKISNSNSFYNLYFDNDKVRLVNNYRHKDAKIQNSISEIYNGKKNAKLTALINDKSIGYYSMNLNGSKYFDLMYTLLQDGGESEYQKEMELVMETMKIILDEEAISKIAPGNGIFVLNEIKYKKAEYTDYDYDDDYNETEVKKTKDVAVPNFTFAFATDNEAYWNRVFNLLITNKYFAKKFIKVGDFYSLKKENNKENVDEMYFTVKDGIVYMTTSMDNIEPKTQSAESKEWAGDSSKYAMSGRLNIQKLISGLEKEFKSPSERKTLDFLKKNIGEMSFKTEVKGESIQTEMDYNIKNSSENSLMYFFDLFDEIYKMNQEKKESKIL